MLDRLIDDVRFHVPVIFALGLSLYFPFLGARDFWGHENDFAEVTRVMLLDGDFWFPKVNGNAWTHNPPLFFTLTALFSWLIGRAGEWSIRLVPAVSAIVFVFFSYRFLARHFDARFAFLATLVLATSLLTIHVERHLPINMVFFLFVILSMFLLAEVIVFDSTHRIHSYGFWAFMGLACLTKGAVGIFLPLLVTILYLSLSGGWKKVLALRPLSGGLLFFAVISPWFLFAPGKRTDVAANVFPQHQHLTDVYRLIHEYVRQFPKSIIYSVANFPVDFLPWSFLLIPAAMYLWRDRGKLREGAGLFLLLWVLSAFFLPQYFVEDHSHYLFLLVLPSAVAMGAFLDRLLRADEHDPVHGYTHRAIIAFCFFRAVAGFVFPIAAHFTWPEMILRSGALGSLFVVAALSLFYALKHTNYPAVVLGFGILMSAISALIQGLVLPSVNVIQVRPFAEKLRTVIKPGSDVGIYAGGHSHDLNFYSAIKRFEELGRYEELTRFLTGPGPKFILVRGRKIGALKEYWRSKLDVVLEQTSGGGGVWLPEGPQWVLLLSCNQECDSTPDVGMVERTSHPLEHLPQSMK